MALWCAAQPASHAAFPAATLLSVVCLGQRLCVRPTSTSSRRLILLRFVASSRLEMLSHAEHSRANVFLEPTRLCLLPFAVVFISSNALQLALSHYLRHPPETLPSGDYTPTLPSAPADHTRLCTPARMTYTSIPHRRQGLVARRHRRQGPRRAAPVLPIHRPRDDGEAARPHRVDGGDGDALVVGCRRRGARFLPASAPPHRHHRSRQTHPTSRLPTPHV